jgi:hypothetical protein
MPTDNPRTPREWHAYIKGLRGGRLKSIAVAAATLEFVRQLQDEGYKAQEISDIFEMFARQFVRDEQEPPSRVPGGYVNYASIVESLR